MTASFSASQQDAPDVTRIKTSRLGQRAKRLVFLAEAYDASEREEFLADVRRLTAQVLGTALAFASPFIRVDAVFVASQRSGVPLTRPRDRQTAFGLYRDAAAPLRLLEPQPWTYSAAKRAAADADATLVLLANDDFYGGLGDDVVIATRSHTSGALALRHELGHVLGDLGEEYDGGDDYSGDNFATSCRPCRGDLPRHYAIPGAMRTEWPCAHWAQNFTAVEAELAAAEWPFAEPPVVREFATRWPVATVDISVAGGLKFDVLVDGKRIMRSRQPAGLDREFFTASFDLPPGMHGLVVNSSSDFVPSHEFAVVCHLQIRTQAEQSMSDCHRTFDRQKRLVGYRPTHRDCLMRDVTLNTFCPVCRRAILRRLLDVALPKPAFLPGGLAPGLADLARQGHITLDWFHAGRRAEPPAALVPADSGCWRLLVSTGGVVARIQDLRDPTEPPGCSSDSNVFLPSALVLGSLCTATCLVACRRRRRRAARRRAE